MKFRGYHENPAVQAVADAVQNVVAVMGACAQSFLYLWQSCGYLDHQTPGKISNGEVSRSRFSARSTCSQHNPRGSNMLKLSYWWGIDVCFYGLPNNWLLDEPHWRDFLDLYMLFDSQVFGYCIDKMNTPSLQSFSWAAQVGDFISKCLAPTCD